METLRQRSHDQLPSGRLVQDVWTDEETELFEDQMKHLISGNHRMRFYHNYGMLNEGTLCVIMAHTKLCHEYSTN